MTAARHLVWPQGQAWLATSPEQWPPRLREGSPRVREAVREFPATAPGWPGAVAVQLASWNASGASYFAQLCAVLTPPPAPAFGARLEVHVDVPADDAAPGLEALVFAGIAALDTRPAGVISLSRLTLHPVDFQAWAWQCCGATAVRLLCADVLHQSDEDLHTLALQVRLHTAPLAMS